MSQFFFLLLFVTIVVAIIFVSGHMAKAVRAVRALSAPRGARTPFVDWPGLAGKIMGERTFSWPDVWSKTNPQANSIKYEKMIGEISKISFDRAFISINRNNNNNSNRWKQTSQTSLAFLSNSKVRKWKWEKYHSPDVEDHFAFEAAGFLSSIVYVKSSVQIFACVSGSFLVRNFPLLDMAR